ncbi:MAG TPA: hypothetical protein VI452_13860 [Marmoricola sp.]
MVSIRVRVAGMLVDAVLADGIHDVGRLLVTLGCLQVPFCSSAVRRSGPLLAPGQRLVRPGQVTGA